MSIVLHMLVDIIMLVHMSIVLHTYVGVINMLCKSPSIYVSKYHITNLQCILFYDHTDNLLANIV